MPALLEIKDLVTNFYTYEGVVRALNKVSLTVDHGITFGLVGESGCGKSVTVRSIMRIIQEPGRIDAGQVFFHPDPQNPDACVDLLKQSETFMESLRGDRISMIFQEPNAALNPILSIGEQVSESFLFHRKKEMCEQVYHGMGFQNPLMRWVYRTAARNPEAPLLKMLNKLPLLKYWSRPLKAEAIRRSVEIIGKLGISNPEEIVRRYPHNLSGGMKQRIVIAIALACNPILLIADEATSNLDVTIQAQILELLKRLKEKGISSILLITHDLGVVAETCDRVGVMYAGNLCEVAAVKDLFHRPHHPYSEALLASVPKFSQDGQLKSIDGSVPNLVEPPSGCRFHPRCVHAMEICRKKLPEMVTLRGSHQVACHLWQAGGERKNKADQTES